MLKECDVTGASRILHCSWDESWHLMERAVARGLLRRPTPAPAIIGVDEKSAGRGQNYITVVSDLSAGTVCHIADERKEASLTSYFDTLCDDQRGGIEAVAMDMWDPYINSVRANLAEADKKIVFDKFHLLTELLGGYSLVIG